MSNILEVRNLQKAYGKYVALKNISFDIKGGRIVGLLGKNGAGKTTLIKTLIGLFREFDGEIIYGGKAIDHTDPLVMNTIGSLVDVTFHEDMTAYDNLKLLMMITPGKEPAEYKKEIDELLEFVGLKENARDKVKSFSFGMKQRLALAQAMIADTKLLILDEPFVGLDPLGIEIVKEKLITLCQERGVSIIFSSHQLAEVAELSDDIIVIADGKIGYSGSYQNLIDANRKYEIRLDVPCRHKEILDRYAMQDIPEQNMVRMEYRQQCLNAAIRDIQAAGYTILDIRTEGNPLLELFKE